MQSVSVFDLEEPLGDAAGLVDAVALVAMNTTGPEAVAMYRTAVAAKAAIERARAMMNEMLYELHDERVAAYRENWRKASAGQGAESPPI